MVTSYLFLAKFLFVYLFLFYLIPTILLRWEPSENWLNKFIKAFIHTHLLIIMAVHFLVAIKLYETISLLFIIFITYLIYVMIRRKKITRLPEMNIIITILKFTEKRDTWKDWIHSFVTFVSLHIKRIIKGMAFRIKNYPFSVAFLSLLFAASLYIRFYHSIQHLYFGAADPYVHLKWAKLLKANQMYVDGVYPFGFEAVISSLHVLFNLDPYIVLRYIGPLSGFMIVLGIYHTMRRNFSNDYMFAIFALLTYFISSFQFGFLWRQLSSLSMEYGAIFVLPGIHFFMNYISSKQRSDFLLCLECFLLTVFIHPYAAICLTISYAMMFLIYLRRFTLTSLMKTVGYFTMTGLIGILPMVIGLLSGIPFHGSSIGFVQESVKSNSFTFKTITLEHLFNQNPHIMEFLICFTLLSIYLVFKKKNKDALIETDLRPFLLSALLLVLFYRSEELGIPSIMMAYRLETFLPILTSVVIGSSLILVKNFPGKRLFQIAIITGFFLYSYDKTEHFQLPVGDRYEYDEAVNTYLKIKKDLPLQNWTIISPIEEYVLCIGYGWHYNLSDFVINLSQGKKMKFPTKDVFIFIENKPIGSASPTQTKGVTDLKMPPVGDPLDYYTEPKYRQMLESKALYWIKNVQSQNKNIFSVYMKTKNMTVYRIQQNANKPIDLSTLLK